MNLSVPPEARSLLELQCGNEQSAADTATIGACRGRYAVVAFPGGLRLRRPICRVPLDWRYGDERGRLLLSFGRAC